ncbi:MAG: phosphoglucosamine mutase, partial [bacterium]|nr:phosphoglucosamine mutase [bacterium]
MTPLMVSVSGIRGIVGESLTPAVVTRYAAAFGSFCGGGKIVIGRDTRKSGPMMEHAVFAGLMAAGCSICNIGINPTPTVQLAVEKLGAAGGIAITASHNPEEWNALKFINNKGRFLGADDISTISKNADEDSYQRAENKELGAIETVENYHTEHIKALLDLETIKVDKIRKQGFKTVVDCVNGAGSVVLPELLQELGCDVIKLNCDPEKPFGRGAEPLPENLSGLCECVRENKADIGFACDPDADRLAIVDNKGKAVGEDYTLVMAADQVLSHQNGPIAT